MFKKADSTVNLGSPTADSRESRHANADVAETSSTKYTGTDRRALPAVIGTSLRIKGELAGDEDLVIQGHVVGTIDLKKNNLTVGAQGSLEATNCRAKIITVEGKMEGDLYADERVVIKQSGDVRGNIVAPRVSLEDGAKFKGSIDMEPKRDFKEFATAQADLIKRNGKHSADNADSATDKAQPAARKTF